MTDIDIAGVTYNSEKRTEKFLKALKKTECELSKKVAFCENESHDVNKAPLVSVIVRTCARPYVLAECLKSIQNQTYHNIEVCIAEDGPNISENFIKENFPKLNVKYCATMEKKGRSYAGNVALSMASGEYFNFLDDDDVFYCDHIETMINAALENPQGKLFYAKAFETPIEIKSVQPYVYKLKNHINVFRVNYSKSNLLVANLFPIQTVFFKREVYEQLGGFSTEYEYLEDWDLWLKYSLADDYTLVDKITSEYRVPAAAGIAQQRDNLLKANEEQIRNKYITTKEISSNGIKVINTQLLKYKIDSAYMISDKVLYVNGWGFLKSNLSDTDFYVYITDKNNKRHILQHSYI